MHNLYCVPLGETMRTSFIEEAEEFVYGQTLFVVPGRILMDEVKKTGNVRTVIMDYLPNELLRVNNAENYTRISRPAQEMLIKQIIASMSDNGELLYFAKVSSKKGFIKNIVSFIGELSRGGITCEEFEQALQAWERTPYLRVKDQEICRIYQLYRQELKKHKHYDVDGLYRLAIKVLQTEGCIVPWEKLYFSEFYQFDNLQIELIKNLAKHCAIDVGLFYDASRPELSKATENAYVDLLGMGFTKQVLTDFSVREQGIDHFVRNWQSEDMEQEAAKGISIFEAYSLENEMRGVLGKIKRQLEAGVAFEDIICIVRSLEEYNGFSNLFKEYGIPTILPEVTGFSAQPLAKLVSGIMEVVGSGYQVEVWQELLNNACVDKIFAIDRELLEESYNKKYFSTVQPWQEFVIAQFPHSKISELFAFITTLKGKQTPADFTNNLLSAIASWSLEKIYGQEYQKGNITLEQLKAVITTKNMIEEILEEMVLAFEQSGQGLKKRPVSDFLEFWQEKAQEKIIGLISGEPQGIKVVEAATIQGILYPHVYLLGMREGQFPKVKFENWIYNDQERKELNELGVTLPLTVTAMKVDQYFFASVVAMAQTSLTISYYGDDAAGASGYLEELKQYYFKEELASTFYFSSVENCFSADELAAQFAQQELLGNIEAAWLANRVGADFAVRKNLDQARWVGENIFNGYLGQKQECKYLSASALDNYVQCPFNYLVSNIWHSQPWEAMEKETNPAVVGDLYHLTLAKFLGRHLGENIGNIDYSVLREEIFWDLSAVYEELLAQGLIFASDFSKYEYNRYQAVLEKWLNVEKIYQAQQEINLLPCALELAFGRKDAQLPGLPISVDNENTIFSGQIDRIDTDGNYYMVTDYKSGAVPSGKSIAMGRFLQLPIYILAMETLWQIQREKIVGAGYYSLKKSKRLSGMWEKDLKQELPWLWKSRPNELIAVMEDAEKSIEEGVRGIRNSAFPANPMDKCPAYCACKDICRYKIGDVSQSMEEGEENV